jgi:hypothetical protein
MPINPETGEWFDSTGLPGYTYGGGFVDQEYDLPLATDPTGTPSWDFQFSGIGQLLKGLGLDTSSGSVLKSLGSLFTGSSDYGRLGQLLGFGGVAALLNKLTQQKPDRVGYQYGVPRYTVSRTQTPLAQQRPITYESVTPKEGEAAATVMRPVPYRPGQGGITYFSPTRYSYAGYEPKKAEDFLTTPAGVTPPPVIPPAGGTTGSKVDTGTPAVLPDNIDFTMPVKNTTEEMIQAARGGYMPGGIAMLAGGRYLRGPGDGVSDSIPAKFERSGQPARLADGEFVIDARTVSEIGNGSSEAGARKLYAMMDRVHKARKTAKRGKPSGADKYLPK